MANSMIGAVAVCLIATISGFHILQKPTHPPPNAPPLVVHLNGTLGENATGDRDIHADAVVAPREDRFSKVTGKKKKNKFSSNSTGKWIPKNNVTLPASIAAPETQEEKEKRLFAEFEAAWKKKKENRVSLSSELDGLSDFTEKVNKAQNWQELQDGLDSLGEVGQTTLRKMPQLRENMMVPDKKERQAAAKQFLKEADKVKDQVLSEKMRLHSEFMRRSHFEMFDAWKEENSDKSRRLSEYDNAVKRRSMRGVPRRPLGDGEHLPNPGEEDPNDL
jgi:hypothetical protein